MPVQTEEVKVNISIEEEDKKKFDKMSEYSKQAEMMNLNDDLLFVMFTHILCMAITISSGYHDNHFAVGNILFFLFFPVPALDSLTVWTQQILMEL